MYGDPEAWPETKARYFEGLLQSKRNLSVALRQGDGPGEQHCYVDMRVFEKINIETTFGSGTFNVIVMKF